MDKEKLNEMVSAYNEIVTFLQEKADYDPETKTAPVLYGDYSITTIRSQLKNPFILAAGGFTSEDSFAMPKDIGLTINSDDMLELDSAVRQAVLARSDLEQLEAVVGKQGQANMLEDAQRLVAEGLTSRAELNKVCGTCLPR